MPAFATSGEPSLNTASTAAAPLGSIKPVCEYIGIVFFAAATVLGITDTAGKYYFPWLGSFLIYLVMVGLLMWRPQGLFGKR